jgi:hypothetical protein
MKSEQTIKRGAVRTAPVGLAGLAGRILAGAVALLLISAAFNHRAWAITGGEVDQNNIYSNVAAGVWFPPDGSEPVIAFSGTLIHPRVLLTAGHVTWSGQQHPEWPPPYVSFGANAFDPATWREIEAAITHPNYNPIAYTSQFANDVGVIILKEPIYDLPLAKLPSAGFLDDLKKAKLLRQPGQGAAPFKVVGYGSTLEWPPKVVTPGDGWRRFADSDYLNVLPGWLNLLQNLATGNGGTAPGDSGGPVFWTDPDTGDEILVSITSWGGSWIGNGFYQRIDTVESLQFIQGVLDSLPAE